MKAIMEPDNGAVNDPTLCLQDDTSDLEIICGDLTFKIHSSIICSQSEYFNTMLQSGFQEANTGKINLPSEDESDNIARMIEFIYSGDYKLDTIPAKQEQLSVLRVQMIHCNMYALGEKYIIPELKHLALDKFQRCDLNEWSIDSEKTNDGEIGFLHLVRGVYNSTPPTDRYMRDLIQLGCDNYKQEHGSHSLEKDILAYVPEAHIDYLKRQLEITQGELALEKERHNETLELVDKVTDGDPVVSMDAVEMLASRSRMRKGHPSSGKRTVGLGYMKSFWQNIVGNMAFA